MKQWQKVILLALLIPMVIFGVFHNFAKMSFLEEDYLVMEETMNSKFSLARFTFRPLFWTSLWLDYKMFGQNPLGFHAMSILYHVLMCISLFLVLASVNRNSIIIPFLFCMLFALHPSNVVNILHIAARHTVLYGLSSLILIFSLIAFLRTSRRMYYGISLFFFITALLCRQEAVMLPFAVILMCLILDTSSYHDYDLKEIYSRKSKYLRIFLPYCSILVLYFLVQGLTGRAPSIGNSIKAAGAFKFTVGCIKRSLQVFFPYSYWSIRAFWGSHPVLLKVTMLFALCAFFVVGAILIKKLGRRILLPFLLGVLFLFTPLFPVLITRPASGVRHVYVPIAFFLIFLSDFVCKRGSSVRRLVATIAPILIVFLISSYGRSQNFVRSSEIIQSVHRDVAEIMPEFEQHDVLLFVNVPGNVDLAAVLGFNTIAYSLYYHYKKDFGHFDSVYSLSSPVITLYKLADEIQYIYKRKEHKVEVSSLNPGVYFYFPDHTNLGAPLQNPAEGETAEFQFYELRILSIHRYGRHPREFSISIKKSKEHDVFLLMYENGHITLLDNIAYPRQGDARLSQGCDIEHGPGGVADTGTAIGDGGCVCSNSRYAGP